MEMDWIVGLHPNHHFLKGLRVMKLFTGIWDNYPQCKDQGCDATPVEFAPGTLIGHFPARTLLYLDTIRYCPFDGEKKAGIWGFKFLQPLFNFEHTIFAMLIRWLKLFPDLLPLLDEMHMEMSGWLLYNELLVIAESGGKLHDELMKSAEKYAGAPEISSSQAALATHHANRK